MLDKDYLLSIKVRLDTKQVNITPLNKGYLMEWLNVDQFETDLLLKAEDVELNLDQIEKQIETEQGEKLQELLESEFC